MVRILGFLPRNLRIYEIAFIHRSASTTCKKGHLINNERLEYLGDAILDAIIADHLYSQFPEKDEGFLTQVRSKIVKRKQLNKIAYNLGISTFLVSNTNSQQNHVNLLGNAFEALIGAVYLDKGYKRAKKFVTRKILRNLLDVQRLARKESDFKSRIIEWAQKNKQDISFVSQEESRPGTHETYFSSQVVLVDKKLGTGTGHSKKDAEQKAAEEALAKIPL
ncbi:ribonuclease III [Bacteroidota bacterium]